MTTRRRICMGLLSFLAACFGKSSGDSPFQQRDGVWHYRDTPVAGSDAGSFVVLSDEYAKDVRQVYFGDTYRKSQEYFAVRHARVVAIEGADAASFVLLDRYYARDSRRIYAEGRLLPVRDPATFAPIAGRPFARDATVAYYFGWEIPASLGSSFEALDDHFARDAQRVYFCDVEVPPNTATPRLRAAVIPDADVASFSVIELGYARDTARLYYRDRVVDTEPTGFELLEADYARTARKVFYRGEALPGAVAASFTVVADSSGGMIGTDGTRRWSQGQRLDASK